MLRGFQLSKQDTNIAFDNVTSELYQVDLDETKNEHTPTFVKVDGAAKRSIIDFILDPNRKDSRVPNLSRLIMGIIGRPDPIPEKEIERYINRILEGFTESKFNDLANNEYTYCEKIKQKIKDLFEASKEKKLKDFLDTDKVFIRNTYTLPGVITPGETAKDIANMPNIAFWTKNI